MKMQNKVQGRLGYNAENKRYGLLVSDLWENSGFHCGECMEVLVGNRWVEAEWRWTGTMAVNGIWQAHRIMAIWSMCRQGSEKGGRVWQRFTEGIT